MCGIAVAIDWEGAETAVGSLIAALMHRGDITDPLVSPLRNTAMCTRRLAIVDAENAVQPQPSFDGRILVSFNGQIYNHDSIRVELEALGVRFRTASDTEVIASALRTWGLEALYRLNGMFAFVAIDVSTGDFVAARDRWGVKPLYAILSAAGFLFCSEISPLLQTVDEGDVMLLPPGYLLTRNGCSRYTPNIPAHTQAVAKHDPMKLDEILSTAVHRRLPPGLPCALMFSGGIDSTLVAHYARQVRPETPGYFIGSAGSPDYDYAKLYADQTGLDLRCVPLDDGTERLAASIADVVQTIESFEPCIVRDSLCTHLLSQRIHRDGFKVVLCGEGADELFSGYVPLEFAFADSQLAGSYVRDQCLGYMHRTNLQRLDRCAMRFELEARDPFLDPAVASYALSLSSAALVEHIGGRPRGKAPLRSLYDLHPDSLPQAIRDRRKVALHEGSGFSQSLESSPWTTLAEDTISDRDFADGRRQYASFNLREKEELLYLRALTDRMDVTRVPHLRDRIRLKVPNIKNLHQLALVAA